MKNVLKVLLIVIVLLALIVGGYVAYVFIDYHRIDDNQQLDVIEPVSLNVQAAQTDKEYTIGTYNVGFGAYSPDYSFFMDGGEYSRCLSEDAARDNIINAAKEVAAEKPDFMMFEEVDLNSTRSYHVDQDALICEVFDKYYETFAVNYDSAYLFYPVMDPIGKSLGGISLYSKYPIESAVRRSLPISTSFSKFFDLDRCYSVNRIPVENGKELIIYVVHTSAYNSDPSIRAGQVDMLINDMSGEVKAGNYVICGGDFNHDLKQFDETAEGLYGWTYPFPRSEFPKTLGFAMDQLTANEIDALENSERNTDAAYDPEVTETFMLDGFIISDNIEMTSYKVKEVKYQYSDHDPVIMKFKLKGTD